MKRDSPAWEQERHHGRKTSHGFRQEPSQQNKQTNEPNEGTQQTPLGQALAAAGGAVELELMLATFPRDPPYREPAQRYE